MKKLLLMLLFAGATLFAQETKVTEALQTKLLSVNEKQTVKVWIYFTDKGDNTAYYFSHPEKVVSKKSLARRAMRMKSKSLIDFRDIPVYNQYVRDLTELGIKIHQRSRWFNSVSGYADYDEILAAEKLPFVKKIDLVRSFKTDDKVRKSNSLKRYKTSPKSTTDFDYGASYTQVEQLNVPAVHNMGIHGEGITICSMDAGFNNLAHEAFANMNIIAMWDFVNNDGNVGDEGDMGEGSHGTETLSTIGGFKEGSLIGPAFGASFLLAKTENTDSETPAEEDNWIAAAEWADSIGVDVTTTSLGYIGMDPGYPGYTWQDMDGNTATITIGADLAVKRGIVVVNSAGNEGDNDSHNTLGAPADGDSVIAVGAVDASGYRVSFSSVGPTVDGRIKPDIMAMGSGVAVASPSSATGYTSSSGTSFSCPLAAGVAALVLSANPTLTPMQVRDALRETASRHNNPDNKYGWGIVDALAAVNYFRVQIEHTPLTDTEDENRENIITATLTSNMAIDESSIYVLFSTDNFHSADSLLLTPTGNENEYSATLPSMSNVTVDYYIKAANVSGVTSYLPLNAPAEFFSFVIGPDTIPPTVNFHPITAVSIADFPVKISLEASDNQGIGNVIVSYNLNGGEDNSFNLTDMNDGTFAGFFPIDSSAVVIGDIINYKISVSDIAATPNTTLLPSDGTYYQCEVSAYQAIANNFDDNDGNFGSTNDWQVGVPANPPGAHSNPNVWGTVLNGEYTSGVLSQLQTPQYKVFGDNPKLTFWHWYDAEEGYDGGNVKISVNGGSFQLITPVGGYDGTLSSNWGNPIGGEDAFTGSSSNWKEVNFDLSDFAGNGDEVVFRFDFGTDDSITKTGWFIDDFSLTDIGLPVVGVEDETTATIAFGLSQNYPNPFNPSTVISYRLAQNGITNLTVYNTLGQQVAQLVNGFQTKGKYRVEFNGDNLPSGVYIYRLRSGSFSATRKMILMK